jgi:copper chaperone CopZ
MEGEINMFSKSKKKKIIIEGMMCEHCAKKVESVLLGVDNVLKVKVNLKDKCAIITYDKEINMEEVNNKISNLDYKVIEVLED